MSITLGGQQKAGPNDNRIRAGRERRFHVGPFGHATRKPDRIARGERSPRALEQLECRNGPANMPARLDTLHDDAVRTRAHGRLCFEAR
jgi:hypothetical protein